eukprot:gene1369-1727_t
MSMSKTLPFKDGVQLTFKNITYSVPNKKYNKQKKSVDKNTLPDGKVKPVVEKELTILHNVSGVIESGDLVALLGPSGSGKSTLLDILAKRKATGTITGDILVNGRKEGGDVFKRLTSYVTQEDVLLQTSTVKETLRFYADLRLPDLSDQEKEERVYQVMEDIGLLEKANSKIGGLSGGQKRRVSIGCGLVTNPSLIFLDEPTSGLDSVTALSIMKTLVNLTKKGVTVICSIHQPRPEIWALFTKSMLILKGRMVYSGDNILEYFSSLGYQCPTYTNPADYILDAAVELGESPRYLEICEKWKSLESETENTNIPPISMTPAVSTSMFYQYKILLKRTTRDFIRNPGNFLARFATAVVIGLLYGACFGGLETTQKDIQKIVGVIFFLVSGINLLPFASISIFISGRTLFNSERAAKIYHSFPYFMATMTVEFFVILVVSIGFTGITYGIADLRHGFGRFIFAMLVFLFVHLLSDLCIITLSNLTGTSDLTFAYGSGLVVIYQLFAGFFVPVQELPSAFGWLHYLNPLYYGICSLMVNEFENRNMICPEEGPCQLPTGEAVLKFTGFDSFTKGEAFGIVVAWTVFFYITSYLALHYLNKEKR